MPVDYRYGANGEFIIDGYDRAKTFAGFLPGIAGVHGIPMWSFYVNRGQALGSFGVRDKNGTIMEFLPFNLMCRNIERQGFRTFVRQNGEVHELFSSASQNDATRTMTVGQNTLSVSETNAALGLRATATYFTMPGEPYAAIVRKLEVERLGKDGCEVEILDGLPQLLPFGVANSTWQAVSNLIKSWFDVTNLDNGIACYKVRASTGDTVEVSDIHACNFHLAFTNESVGLLPTIYDMDVIFGQNTALSSPDGWDCPLEELLKRRQVPENKVSGGFAGARTDLKQPFVLYTVVGHAASPALINGYKARFTPEFIEIKQAEATALARGLVENVETHTANPVFDRYVGQCALDNLVRGGYPMLFTGEGGDAVYHVYSRKHGDLEREYNFFSLEPEYFSQGNGNFRDINQNRRSDVLLHPWVGDFNVRHFMSLIQADGYNPLVVKGCSFTARSDELGGLMELAHSGKEELGDLLSGRFTPGKLMTLLERSDVKLDVSVDDFVAKALGCSEQHFEADFGEGYWSDHWTYNMDLVDSYLAIYPDREEEFLFGNSSYRFFDSGVRVLPRDDRYVLSGGKVRQYGSVHGEGGAAGWLKTQHGEGSVYETNLFSKLLHLALMKFVSLDPFGIGIEMEAGRPGWNDAMNGLPGLFGSGVSETAELKRIVAFLADACETYDRVIPLFNEAASLLSGVTGLLEKNLTGQLDPFGYWDRVSALKEEFRDATRRGIGGGEQNLRTKSLLPVLSNFLTKLGMGLDEADRLGAGIPVTYCTYSASSYQVIEGKTSPMNGCPNVRVTAFDLTPLPLFLEAPARVLKLMNGGERAAALYGAVKASGIYDRKLEMYKTSEPLNGTTHEIGRIMAFTPGWLERESVFLHMEYKYLYAMLKAGLHHEFYSDIQTMLIPFLNPEVYGRSTLENSSFLASSVNPDETTHGRGFVARLSGSTAEMLSMWFHMMTGGQPFTVEDGQLTLRLRPVLPGWLFDAEGKVSFRFLGSTEVIYSNVGRLDTFGPGSVSPSQYTLTTSTAKTIVIDGPVIGAPWAEAVRSAKIAKILICLS